MISASASPCARIGRRAAFRLADQALAFGIGDRFNALPFNFRLFQHGGDQLAFAARDFGVLDLHLRFALDLLDAHLLKDHGLLLAVGFDFIGLVGLRLGLLLISR